MPPEKNIIISTCDYTGKMVEPWLEAGYSAILVDPQHEKTSTERAGSYAGQLTKLAATVEDALPYLLDVVETGRVAGVFNFPPCTHLAGSGARWWKDKDEKRPELLREALDVVAQCALLGEASGAPWLVENPVGRLSKLWRKPNHYFNPYDYTLLAPEDNYSKKTCLWTGGGFIMPPPLRDESLGKPDNRIHMCPPGPERMNIRSATPIGFARAVFEANHRP